MSGALFLYNRQRTRKINSALLRKIISGLLDQILKRDEYELGLHLVTRRKITELNETYLQHQGSTDVITFDLSDGGLRRPREIDGEIVISVDMARREARRRRLPVTQELLRYAIHGTLHLCGYDDRTAAQRRRIRAAEDAVLAVLSKRKKR